jgi:hypothetical protein
VQYRSSDDRTGSNYKTDRYAEHLNHRACKSQNIKQTDTEAGSQETKLRYHLLDRRVRNIYPRGGVNRILRLFKF